MASLPRNKKSRHRIESPLSAAPEEYALLLAGREKDPHAFLGMHNVRGGIAVRAYDPMAEQIFIHLENGARIPMEKLHEEGIFEWIFPRKRKHFFYQLEKIFRDGNTFISPDPYQYLPTIGDVDQHLFNAGEHRKIYEVMGCHYMKRGDHWGAAFAVWAPNAQRVSVVGSFNCWDGRRHPMRLMGSSGIWELFIPDLSPGDLYKFEVVTLQGEISLKADPYARRIQMRPDNAGIIPNDPFSYQWQDAAWMEDRKKREILSSPMAVYEVHLASWRHPSLRELEEGEEFHNYRELAIALAEYLKETAFTHVELLPLAEHVLDQSWGYQVSGMYAPTSRFGTPEDFAFFVDHLHKNGFGVILDWVPAHFPKDTFSLGKFDGTSLYEYEDPRRGEHKEWGTYVFNFGRHEVRNFLIGSALYFLETFHIDGLRVDAVASMLYWDYCRKEGEWIPNADGSNQNWEAASFLRRLNELTHELFPGSSMIAEESTSWPGVSRPAYAGGLGFTFKWNMGWMHDTLDYFSLDPLYRAFAHNKITFSMMYAYSENFVLPFSHDEVVHGKKSLLDRMPGDYDGHFASLRSLYFYMYTHPGKKLLFMGGEYGQWIEWNSDAALDWHLLTYPRHTEMKRFVSALNSFYRENPTLWELDYDPAGFQWVECGDSAQSILTYLRRDKEGNELLMILNLTPLVREEHITGVPAQGLWREIFNTDESRFGGKGVLNPVPLTAEAGEYQNQPCTVKVRLPGLGGIILAREE